MELRHKKILNHQFHNHTNHDLSIINASSVTSVTLATSNNNTAEILNSGDNNSIIHHPSTSTTASDSSSYSSSSQFSSSALSLNVQQKQNYVQEDPRLSDPNLKKFFFRQRVTSQSKHPNIHYQ